MDFTLTQYTTPSQVVAAVAAIQYLGEYTNTTGGLWLAEQILTTSCCGARGPTIPKIIVLLTDGVPNVNVDQLQATVSSIKSNDIRIVTIGVTNMVTLF